MKIQLMAAVLLFAGAMGCGGSTVAGITKNQSDAINAATSKTCDSYARCGEIGTGKSFTAHSLPGPSSAQGAPE